MARLDDSDGIGGFFGGYTLDQLTKDSVELDSARELLESLKMDLKNPVNGHAPLKVPVMNGDQFFLVLMKLIEDDEWMRKNVLFVLFDDANGQRLLAVGRMQDRDIWEGPMGQVHLRSININTYSCEEYMTLYMSCIPPMGNA